MDSIRAPIDCSLRERAGRIGTDSSQALRPFPLSFYCEVCTIYVTMPRCYLRSAGGLGMFPLELAFCKTRSRIIGGCLGYLSYALHGITVVWIVAGITELTLVYG